MVGCRRWCSKFEEMAKKAPGVSKMVYEKIEKANGRYQLESR